MKFSSSVLVSCFFFFIAAASAVDATLDDTSGGPGRPRRTLFGKKNPAAAAAAAAAAAPAPSQELAVQGGPDCSITQQASTGKYTLSATVGKETVLFAERPVRTARKLSTEEFVDKFADIFFTSNPNAAVTFTSTTASADNNNNGPLIVVLSQTRMVSSSIIEYTMTQSESQAKVASMDQFLETSGACSIFIDSFGSLTSHPTCVKSEGTYISDKDFCYSCGGGDEYNGGDGKTVGYCWNSQNPQCPPACGNVQGVSGRMDGNCGDACHTFLTDCSQVYDEAICKGVGCTWTNGARHNCNPPYNG